VRKNLDHSRLISQNDFGLPKEFRKIAMEMAMVNSYEDWVELYKKYFGSLIWRISTIMDD
jgi:hypothetical protein